MFEAFLKIDEHFSQRLGGETEQRSQVEDEEHETCGRLADEGKFFLGKIFMSCMVRRQHFQHAFRTKFGFCISSETKVLTEAIILEERGIVTTKRRRSACLQSIDRGCYDDQRSGFKEKEHMTYGISTIDSGETKQGGPVQYEWYVMGGGMDDRAKATIPEAGGGVTTKRCNRHALDVQYLLRRLRTQKRVGETSMPLASGILDSDDSYVMLSGHCDCFWVTLF
ncbi:Hypothetical predicted protein [Olea europaea subsp. europaea]|uniref:Uncharacterized protein n=1 Tax=Olea europaea subsp. europaea TaxID=158383 RepID=A0A8S0UNG8_OLEEU|nr:Hypothetical predicted protein [Olea europaea subsp. europaea]